MMFGGGELLNVKRVFLFSVQSLSETLLNLTRIQQYIIINVRSRVQNFRPDIQKPRQMENAVRDI